MVDPGFVLMMVRGMRGAPTLDEAARQLGVAREALNAAFGVIAIDPAQALFAVEVRADQAGSAASDATAEQGPFSNPPIAPFGPIQPPAGPGPSDADPDGD
jgi:hypothetical protein